MSDFNAEISDSTLSDFCKIRRVSKIQENRSGVFIANFEYISHLVLVFLLLIDF